MVSSGLGWFLKVYNGLVSSRVVLGWSPMVSGGRTATVGDRHGLLVVSDGRGSSRVVAGRREACRDRDRI